MKAKILVRSSTLRTVGFFANAGVALLLTPFLIHSLGDRMYGLWILVGSLLGFYWFFDLGLSSAIQRYLSRAIGNADTQEMNAIISTSLFLYFIIAFLTIFILLVIMLVAPLFMSNLVEVALFKKIVLICGLAISIGFPMYVFSGILVSYIRFDILVLIEIIKLAVRTILILFFLSRGHGIISLAIISFITAILGHIFTYIFSRKIAPDITFSPQYISQAKIKTLFKYSIFTLISSVADNLRFNLDNFVITAFVGLNFVTLYSIASRLVRYFSHFILNALGMMLPVFSQYEAKGDYEKIREKFLFVTKISGYLSVLIGGTLLIFGRSFIERWVGAEYAQAYPVLVILTVPSIFALMQSPSVQLLFGISKNKFYAISNTAEGVANLILSLLLVRKFGIIGVAVGTAVPMILIKLLVQPVYTCRLIGLSVRKYYLEILVSILLKSSAILAIFWVVTHSFIIPDYFRLSILAICEIVLFMGLVFFVGFKASERGYLRKTVFNSIA